MASNFPTSVDNFTDPVAGDPMNSPSHSGLHRDVNAALENIENKVGIDSSNSTSTLEVRAPRICNSATRPAGVVGRSIYETDTGSFLVYYGSTTGWRPPWQLPWGEVLFATYSTTQTSNFTQNYNVPIVLNRLYLCTLTGQFRNNTDACGVNFNFIFDGSNPGALTALVPGANREGVASCSQYFQATATKTALVGFTVSVANGGTFTWNPSGFAPTHVTVSDIGPATTTPPAA